MRKQRQKRIRAKIEGTKERPRVAVFRSNQFISAQVIDDDKGLTLASEKGAKNKPSEVGVALAKKMSAAGITKVVFDRGGYKYHGSVKELAEALRKNGITF